MKKLLFSSLIIFGFNNPANAIPLPVDSGVWAPFFFNDTTWLLPQSFEFTLTKHAKLQITDAFEPGDVFEISNNGSSLGLTSMVLGSGVNIKDNYDAAFADPDFSSIQLILDPGSYSITGTVTQASPVVSGSDTGQGGIRVDTIIASISEPAVIWLTLIGLSGLLFLKRKSVHHR